jgi:hypothetical protein
LVGPNPAKSCIRISSAEENRRFKTIRIYNSNGKLVDQFPFSEEIEISSLSNGIYFIEAVSDKNEVFDGRFVKQ